MVPLNESFGVVKNVASNLRGIEFLPAIGQLKSFAALNVQNQLVANERILTQQPNSIFCTKLPRITQSLTCIKNTKPKQSCKDG
jgi:hypothetical protein